MLTGATVALTVVLAWLQATAEPGTLRNLLGLAGVVGVLAVLGFAWALIGAWREQATESRDG